MNILILRYSYDMIGMDAALKRLGHNPVVVTYDPTIVPDCTHFVIPSRTSYGLDPHTYKRYIRRIYSDLIRYHDIDMVLPGPAMHGLLPILGGLNSKFELPGIQFNRAAIMNDKEMYFGQLRDGGLTDYLPTRYGVIDESGKFFGEIKFPCILKPSLGSGGVGIFVANNKAEFDWFLESEQISGAAVDLRDPHPDGGYRRYMFDSCGGGSYLIDQYIHGDVVSVAGVVINKAVHCDIIYDIEVTDPPAQSEIGFHYPSRYRSEIMSMFNILDDSFDVLDYANGPFMADFIRSYDGRYYLIDLAPRMSTSAYALSQQASTKDWYLARCVESFSGSTIDMPPRYDIEESSRRVLMFPKGEIKSVSFPEMSGVYVERPPMPGMRFFETRNDKQTIARGVICANGPDARKRTQEFLDRTKIEIL